MSEDKKDININNSLHTLEGDLLASMKDENYESNIVKIISHDEKKTSGDTSEQKDTLSKEFRQTSGPGFFSNPSNIYFLISVFFILVIGGGAYYFIVTYKATTLTPATVSTTTNRVVSTTTQSQTLIQSGGIFNAEIVLPIKITTYNKNQLIDRINQAKQELLNKKVKNRTNISLITDVSLTDFLNKIQFSGPESLIRSFPVEKTYSIGLYHTQNTEFENYFIAKIDIFDLAFSGMLEWESGLPIDLEKIYTYATLRPLGTSTEPTSTPYFTDKVIKNIDVRVYDDTTKGVRIIYGIVNKQYLLITSGEASFVDIVNKLLVNNVLR